MMLLILGKLNIIQKDELKIQLSNWSRIIDDTHKDENILNENVFNVLILYLNDKTNNRNYPIPQSLLNLTRLKKITPSNFKPNYNKIMTSLEFENILNGHAINIMYTIGEYMRIKKYIEETIKLIDTQLK